jgi:hypothetical protein
MPDQVFFYEDSSVLFQSKGGNQNLTSTYKSQARWGNHTQRKARLIYHGYGRHFQKLRRAVFNFESLETMKCPKCGFEQTDQNTECIYCGIVFEKYYKYQSAWTDAKTIDNENDNIMKWITNILFYIKPDTSPVVFVFRILFFAVMVMWGFKFIITPLETNYTGQSVWHLINLPFHEAGHIIFRPLGRLMTSLGGSLGQLLIPFMCLVTFLIKTRDTLFDQKIWFPFGHCYETGVVKPIIY